MKHKFFLIVSAFVVFSVLVIPQPSFAACTCLCTTSSGTSDKGSVADLAACGTACSPNPVQSCSTISNNPNALQDPLGNRPIQEIIGSAIKVALGIVGSLALLFFIYGGFLWMTAGGSPEKVKKGKETLVWATIGLAVIFTSYGILSFVFSALRGS